MRLVFPISTVFILLVTACQDVVEVDVPTSERRLIVDALIRVDTSNEWIGVKVKVAETSDFFKELSVTSLDNISIDYTIFGDDGSPLRTETSNLIEADKGSGVYEPDTNLPAEQRISTRTVLENPVLFTLNLVHKGRAYTAQTRYVPSTPILDLMQGEKTLFSEDETEVTVTFGDNPDLDNYYVFDFDFDQFLVSEDTFYNGQEFRFSYFYDKNLSPGQEVTISILGADKTFYNYMNSLIAQGEQPQGPFQTPVATVRGNVFELSDLNMGSEENIGPSSEFPLGYFAIVQEFKQTITIQ